MFVGLLFLGVCLYVGVFVFVCLLGFFFSLCFCLFVCLDVRLVVCLLCFFGWSQLGLSVKCAC